MLNNDIKMSIFEHIEELRNRTTKSILFFFITSALSFFYVKDISFLLQQPAHGVKFLQLAPGEYFFSSIKISGYTGLIISSPFIIYQILLFILPGLTDREVNFFLPTLLLSIILFFTGVYFAFNILIPAALKFLIYYGADVIEPIWSFEQYLDFVLLLLVSTGLAFQIPIIQIVVGLLNIISSNQMLQSWRYILLTSTIISAVLTPSTDPLTQIILSSAILILYFTGIFVLRVLKK